MTDEKRFCTRCGAMLPEGSSFCTECGTPVDGGANPYSDTARTYRAGPSKAGSMVRTLLLVYVVLAVVAAVSFLYIGIALNEAMYNELADMYADFGYILSPWDDFLKTQMIAAGVFMLMSAAAAFASYSFCKKRGPKKNAVNSCAIASVLTLGILDPTAIVLVAIGFVVTYMIYKDNTGFDS